MNIQYKPFNQFVLRTPLLSYNRLKTLMSNEDRAIEQIQDTLIEEAIFLASPLLYREIKKVLDASIQNKKEINRVVYSFVRYLCRMSTRCTPFGLFAGCSLGEIGENTNIYLSQTTDRTTRLDMNYLCSLYDNIAQDEFIKPHVKYITNSSLYSIGRKYRYVEYNYTPSGRSYHLTELEKSPYLNMVIKRAQKGAYIQDLVSQLVSDYISEKEAKEYITEIIDSQIIIPELSNIITGEDYLTRIINFLQDVKIGDSKILSLLLTIKKLLHTLDTSNESKMEIYEKLITTVKSLGIPYKENRLVQVDLLKHLTKPTLGVSIIKELQRTMVFLNKITHPYEKPQMGRFKEQFQKRYEEQEMPLMETLDPEVGIGYPVGEIPSDTSPFLDGIPLPRQVKTDSTLSSTPFHLLLHSKYLQYLKNGDTEIVFKDEDVKDYPTNWNDLPPTLQTMFEVINSEEDLLISVNTFCGSSAANLISRFAHLDKNIERYAMDITAKEQELLSENIIAEIVHLPEAGVGNIGFRPHLREYEILCNANSTAGIVKTINLSDLMISLLNGKFHIRSKRLNKSIIPRLTCAHNFDHPRLMSVYRFLCDLQTQGCRNVIYFSWPPYLYDCCEYLPRVRYGNSIISPATWYLKKKEWESLCVIESDELLIQKIATWRENKNIPRYSLLSDSDNTLFIDWHNILCIRSFFSIIKNRQTIKLTEFLFNPDTAPVKGDEEVYLNECIVSFYKE